jgi:hypothetical protein
MRDLGSEDFRWLLDFFILRERTWQYSLIFIIPFKRTRISLLMNNVFHLVNILGVNSLSCRNRAMWRENLVNWSFIVVWRMWSSNIRLPIIEFEGERGENRSIIVIVSCVGLIDLGRVHLQEYLTSERILVHAIIPSHLSKIAPK